MNFHPAEIPPGDMASLRARYLLSSLSELGAVKLHYWEIDRTIIGGVVPISEPLHIPAGGLLGSSYFCERRELGVINMGAPGTVEIGGHSYALGSLDGLYVGRGTTDIIFHSSNANEPARFYLLSYPAHRDYPVRHVEFRSLPGEQLGSAEDANRRTIFKYFAPGLVETCQLTMGLTMLQKGSVWNTMPPHTHLRRSEVYCYFGLAASGAVFHFMGEPSATRHLLVRDFEAVLSPSWSIHMGVGTSAYSFIWGMGGENQEFTDMQKVAIRDLS